MSRFRLGVPVAPGPPRGYLRGIARAPCRARSQNLLDQLLFSAVVPGEFGRQSVETGLGTLALGCAETLLNLVELFAKPVVFPGEVGNTAAHLRREHRKGREADILLQREMRGQHVAELGEQALRVYSLDEAELCFRQVLELAESVPGCADEACLVDAPVIISR